MQASLPFQARYFGTTYSTLYVNSGGNVSFAPPAGFSFFSPGLPTDVPTIAPYFSYPDINAPGTNTFGTITFGGRTAFCVNWLDVGSTQSASDRNSFQLLLVDRSDLALGDFDVIFNYDQVEWDLSESERLFCPDPNDLNNCMFELEYASVGYSSGGLGGFKVEMPGSTQGGVFVDHVATGLVHNSLGGLQLGRYRFEIRATGNGNALIEGVVTDAASGAPLAGAHVQLCRDFVCYITTTNSSGHYAFLGLVAGDYSVTAFPAGLSHFQSTVPVPALGGAEARVVNIMLTGPTPPPFGASITPAQVNSQGVPRVFWNNPITLTISACPGGTATWEVHKNGVLVPGRSGTMTEAPAGTFKASIPALNPTSGAVEMVIAVTCPDGSTSSGEFDFNIYIDPSGVVMDTFGTLQVGATVTLFRSDQPGGPFTQVPDGSAIMSPSNRTNPDLTDSVGHFGWDVIAGYYTVRAEKAGCTDPANSAQAFVETEVLTIPPPVFDLELVLECPQADFTSLIPARILDTRLGIGGISTKVGPGATVDVPVVGVGGVPATGVGAVVLNVTVTEPTAPSWLTVFPAGEPLPLASNLNFVPGQDVPNLVVAKVGDDGEVSVHNNAGSTHVIFDAVGWFPETSSFTSLVPARILDSRLGVGGISAKVGPGATVNVPVTGVGGVPSTGVGAVVLNVTVTEPTAPSWLTVFPAGEPLPLASNLNFLPGQDVPNLVVAKVGDGGQVSIYNSAGSTHVVADVVGWFPSGGTSFTSLTPARILDTRFGTGGISAKIGPASSVDVAVTGVGGVPSTGVGAVVLNVTVTQPSDQSWLTVYPAGQPLPVASNLNFLTNQDVANLVVAKVGDDGKVSVHNNAGSTHVIFDVVGYFAA